MTHISEEHVLNAELQYLIPSDEKPVYYASQGGKEAKLEVDGKFEMHSVPISNARYQSGEDFSLDKEGFTLVPHVSTVNNFYNENELKERYLPEAEALVAKITGASRVVAFDHTLRADSEDIRGSRQTREPSTVVHNDYTARSGPQRVRDILGEATAKSLLQSRFAIVNVWRAIQHPVVTTPLAVCDAQSVMPEDLIAVERRAKDRTGELLLATYNRNHRWYYFERMEPDEALLIKTFDSVENERAGSCIHTAFTAPDVPKDSPPRESIEVRTFAFFD